MDKVREADPDRYVSTLYAPEAKRPALFALYAFNAEVAGIRDRVREALPGEIRIQWWREVVAAERPADGHPIAEALLEAIAVHGLPRKAFDDYLEARLFDLYDDPMPSRTDLEGYCGETASAVIQLAALVLDAPQAPKFAGLAGHAGCAQAIAGLLRLLPLHRARGQCYLPRDVLAASGTTPEGFLAGDDPAAQERALQAMLALAHEHLRKFAGDAANLPQGLRPAFLPVALVPRYLDALSRQGARALRETEDLSPLRRHWAFFRTATRGW